MELASHLLILILLTDIGWKHVKIQCKRYPTSLIILLLNFSKCYQGKVTGSGTCKCTQDSEIMESNMWSMD